jgi:2-aminoadipate transaminase
VSGPSQTTVPTISFARGAPSTDIVDVEGLKQAAVAAFDEDPAGLTAYGTAVGYLPLRRWIAEKHGVPEEQVLVTNGSMQADAFLFDELVRPGAAVITERPTYDRTLLGLKERGADLHLLTLEEDGLAVDEVVALVDGGVRPALAHVIPNFQNPAGYTLSLAKRQRLLELAREHGFVIFEDDPYVDVRFTGEPLPRMLELDGGAESTNVVYASSFSKTVCPGVRVGYLVGPPPIIDRIRRRATNTYIAPNMVAQGIVNQFVRGPRFAAALDTVKTALAERAAPRAATSCGCRCPRARATTSPGSRRRPPCAASASWRAPTSCSRAGATRSGWPTRACRPGTSTRASAGSPKPSPPPGRDRQWKLYPCNRLGSVGKASIAWGQPELRRAVAMPLMVSWMQRLTSSSSSPSRRRRSISTCRWCSGSR